MPDQTITQAFESPPLTGDAMLPSAVEGYPETQETDSARSGPNIPTLPAVPGFALEQEVARGGMGVIYQARDLAMNRKVAIKLLQEKYAVDSPVAARFIEEAHITGQLQHPGIPPIYQVGRATDGRPFLAMKLIKGQTLDDLIKSGETYNKLAVIEAIAQAVGFAHAHGVIHRDLKPHNIMVGAFGEVQVMDWGLAKLLSSPPSGRRQPAVEPSTPPVSTLFNPRADSPGSDTRAGNILGTPAYIPPEQAKGDLDQTDQRSDVFGLGAILCQMLTGRPVYIGDMRMTLAQATLGQTGDAFARLDASGAEPDVIALCKRCLAFDPEDRPAEGNTVAAAVAALRHAAEERAKQAEIEEAQARVYAAEQHKRRRVWIGLAAVLLVGALASSALALWAVAAERLAAANAEKERLAKEAETRERKYAEAIADFVKNDVFALTSLEGQDRFGGGTGLDRNASLLDLLNRGAEKLRERQDLDPRIEAALSWIIGVNYRGAGEAAKGVPFLERAVALRRQVLGAEHEDTLDAMNSLAVCYDATGKLDKALPLYEETLMLRKAKLGPDHPDTLTSMGNLAEGYRAAGQLAKALPLLEETVKLRKAKLGADHPLTLSSMAGLAAGYRVSGQLNKALPLYEETLKLKNAKLGPNHPDTLSSMNNLAAGYQDAGQLAQALPLFEETLKLTKAKLGPDHPDTLSSMNNLAAGYHAAGQLAKALPLNEETLKLRKAKLGPDHPDTLTSMNNLAAGYKDAGQLAKALPLLEETLKLRKAKLGPDHPDTLSSMNNLAAGYHAAGQLDKALPLYEETVKLRKAKLGPDHPDTLNSMGNLAAGYRAAGQLAQALPLLEETLKLTKAKLGPDHPATLNSMNNLARGYQAAGQLAKALPLYEETLKLRKAKLGPDHSDTLISMNNLALGYQAAGQLAKALPLLEETLKLRKAKLGADHPDTLTSMNNLARGFHAAGQLDKALPLYEEAAQGVEKRRFQHEHARLIIPNTIRAYEQAEEFEKAAIWRQKWLAHVKTTDGADSSTYAGELAALGDNLLQQQKWTEAETILRECLTIREAIEPEEWTTFNTQSMLGGALLGQKKYAEAEPLLLKGYEGMKAREKTIPPQASTRIPEALDRLIALYTALEKPDEVKKYQAEKARLQ